MSNLFVPIKTAKISWKGNVPYSIEYQDIYFSVQSGIEQSNYVFVSGNQLIERWKALPTNGCEQFCIAETGFGSGLNFLLAWSLWEKYAPKSAQFHFITCEKHPLSREDLKQCVSLWPELDIYASQLINSYPVLTPGYHHLIFSNGRVRLTIMLGEAVDCYEQLLHCGDSKLESMLRARCIDAWFLDGFSPSKNESMWSDSLFSIIAMLSKQGTTLATYTVAAPVKARLVNNGFTVEKKKGFAGKRHMLTAQLNNMVPLKLKKLSTPWHVARCQKFQEKKAIVIGGGLAGCFTAYALANRGWKITLFDELDQLGMGASGNVRAVLFPKISAFRSPFTQLMLSSFLFSSQFYQQYLSDSEFAHLNGALLLDGSEKEANAQHSLQEWLNVYPELARFINSQEASHLTGVPITQSGLFIPFSGWLDSTLLCNKLANTEGISIVLNSVVEHIEFENEYWIVNGHRAPTLIIANGYKLNRFKETQHLPVKPIRGQMSIIRSNEETQSLKIPLCGDGHVLPQIDGHHYFGATYELNVDKNCSLQEDDLINHSKLKALPTALNWSESIVGHWSGVRGSTPDYLPLVGPLPIAHLFLSRFSGLENNAKRWIPHAGDYYSGLYVCAGFGSRGLTTIPLCAEWLASQINHEISCLPRSLTQAFSPARFLRREIVRRKSI